MTQSLATDKAIEFGSLNLPSSVSDPAKIADSNDSWAGLFKSSSRPLKRKGKAFTLPSGEVCVKIPNSVIEKHKRAWDCFVLGQFYSEPPNQGTVHAVANKIWSRRFKDISVTKMEGFSYLFRIPNSAIRHRVLSQGLWQVAGQTMFVAKWEPGPVPQKPELTSAPVWLELRNVPHQFFNEDGFEFIAGLVGEPKGLHPSTANLTNLEVAKVLTLIDPRKPLPEAVNVQFESGEFRRVLVSSPWMPPICSYCKEVGHNIKRCKSAPIICSGCNSVSHTLETCPRAVSTNSTSKQQRSGPTKKTNGIVFRDPPVAMVSGSVAQVQWAQVLPPSRPKGKQRYPSLGKLPLSPVAEHLTLNHLHLGLILIGSKSSQDGQKKDCQC